MVIYPCQWSPILVSYSSIQWSCILVSGHLSLSFVIYPCQWSSILVTGHISLSMVIYPCKWSSINVNGHLFLTVIIYPCQRSYILVNGHLSLPVVIYKQQQPQYFNSFTHETNSDIHSHNRRRRNELHIPKTKHDFAKTNLWYNRILQTINELPDTVASKVYTHSINGVTNYAKQYFIAACKIECTIGNCYICQHTLS